MYSSQPVEITVSDAPQDLYQPLESQLTRALDAVGLRPRGVACDMCGRYVRMVECLDLHIMRFWRRCQLHVCENCRPFLIDAFKERYRGRIPDAPEQGKMLELFEVLRPCHQRLTKEFIRQFSEDIDQGLRDLGYYGVIVFLDYRQSGPFASGITLLNSEPGYLVATILWYGVDPTAFGWFRASWPKDKVVHIKKNPTVREALKSLFEYEIPSDPNLAAESEAAFTGVHHVRAKGFFYGKSAVSQSPSESPSEPVESKANEDLSIEEENTPIDNLPEESHSPLGKCPKCGKPIVKVSEWIPATHPEAQLSHPRWRGGG